MPASVPSAGDYVRSFNRFEFKYLVPEPVAAELAAGLEGHAERDPHSGPGGYPVRSVYWDSPGLTFFWEKVDGEKYRRKLRFRTYPGAGERVFVEIKQRIDRTVQKRRVAWPPERVEALFGSGRLEAGVAAEVTDPVIEEALFLCRYHELRPTIAVGYRREAFVALLERDLRITFDRRVQYDAHALDPGRPFETGPYVLDPETVVVEIKFNDCVPLWLTGLVARHGLSLNRFSKYCGAVDRERFGGRFT